MNATLETTLNVRGIELEVYSDFEFDYEHRHQPHGEDTTQIVDINPQPFEVQDLTGTVYNHIIESMPFVSIQTAATLGVEWIRAIETALDVNPFRLVDEDEFWKVAANA